MSSSLKSDTHTSIGTIKCIKAFDDVKTALSQAPALRYFDQAKDLVLKCDASESGLGARACLFQDDQPIVF